MFKTQLSASLIPEKIIIAVVPLLTFFSFSAMPVIISILVLLLMLMLVPYSIYTIYMAHLNIAFDASLAYITDRKTERIIALKSITGIKPESNTAILRRRWQISYIENSVEEELFFYPADDTAVQQFIKTVRTQNPMVSASN
jgi:c-di-AMP phosphodiesterase-like protein